jgi:tetratricopeptide (TPR) repeat protein
LFFVLALLSKPMLVTLPCVMLLLDYWPSRRFEPSPGEPRLRRALPVLLEKLPFFGLTALISVVTLIVCTKTEAIGKVSGVSMSGRIENAFVAYARYLSKTFWPVDLALPYIHPGHWPLTLVSLGALLVIGLSIGALLTIRRWPYVFVGWFWFLGTLVPVIGLVQWGLQSMADRFTYIPSIGLFIMLVWSLAEAARAKGLPNSLMSFSTGALLLALALRSEHQLRYWQNDQLLFFHAIQVTDRNYMAYDSLGSALNRHGAQAQALALCKEAVRLNPNFAEGQYDLATILVEQGRPAEAIPHFEAALKSDPKFAMAHNNLGNVLLKQGKVSEAAEHFQAAIKLNPEDADPYFNLGTLWIGQSNFQRAIDSFSEALRLKPNYAQAESNLAVALARQGHPDQAAVHFARAADLEPRNPQAHFNLGVALLELNQPAKAAKSFSTALGLDPQSARSHYHLALALLQQGDSKGAISHAQQASDLAKAAGNTQLADKAAALVTSAKQKEQ